jgi:hypothetical protein
MKNQNTKNKKGGFTHHFIFPVIVIIAVSIIGIRLYEGTHASTLYGPIIGVGGKCLDDAYDRRVNSNKIQLYTCNKSASQDWRYNSNGTITNTNGYCLDVTNSDTTAGSVVQLYQCNDNLAEQWVVDEGTGTISNPHAQMCIDDKEAITKNGNTIQIWNCLGNKQQKWAISAGSIRTGSTTTSGQNATCLPATGPFSVSRTNIIDGNGDVFVPYGVTLSTMQYYPGTYLDNTSETTLAQTEKQISAIAKNWCSNTVRLQIEQDELVGIAGTSVNSDYLNVIKSSVSYAEKLGLSVVINPQTEPGGTTDVTANEPLPTTATEAFWSQMDKLYASDTKVVYDIFNEPRPYNLYTTTQPESTYWNDWLKGGTFTYADNSQNITIVGLSEQGLADYIRSNGSKNLFWVEGLNNLDYVVASPSEYLLKGDGPIAYEFHHTANGLQRTAATWDSQFGGLVKNNDAPVVDGEWTNYTNNTGYTYPNGDSGECWSDAPTSVPAYLKYLQTLGIGMTVWTLGGFMTSGPGVYATPSQINKATWACKTGLGQGAGQLVQEWFNLQNIRE